MKKIGIILCMFLLLLLTANTTSEAKEELPIYPISLRDGTDTAGKTVIEDPVFLEYLQKAEFTSGEYEGLSFDMDGDGFLSAGECELVRVISLNGEKELGTMNGLEAFPKLRELYCGNTNVNELDLSGNIKLKKLDCHNANLKELDLTACIILEYLDIHGNGLTALDLTHNSKLTYADLSKQQRFAGEYENNGKYWADLSDLNSALDLEKVCQVEIDGACGDGINSDYKTATGQAVCSDYMKELSYRYKTGYEDTALEVTLQLSLGIRRLYDSQGGSRVPAQYYLKGESDIAPEIPRREGFVFKGWYANAKCEGEAWPFGVLVSDSSILYAKWEKDTEFQKTDNQVFENQNKIEETVEEEADTDNYPSSYTIIYKTGTKKTIKSVSGIQWGNRGIVPKKKPKRKNYQFVGWKSVSTGKWVTYKTKLSKSVSDGSEENIVLKAIWVKKYEKSGKRFKRYGIVYQILKSSGKKCTVKVVSKKRKKRKIPKKVFYNGRFYKVIRNKRNR